jgi:type IV pilus assembly protein PilV
VSVPNLERRQDEAGFTLIEALIAILILMVGLIGVANLFTVAASSNRVGNTMTGSATEAMEVLERLKALPFRTLAQGGSLTVDQPAVSTTPDVTAATYNCQRTVPGVGTIRSRWTIVQPRADDPDTLFITVRSEVQGAGLGGGRLSRSEFATYRTCTAQNG